MTRAARASRAVAVFCPPDAPVPWAMLRVDKPRTEAGLNTYIVFTIPHPQYAIR